MKRVAPSPASLRLLALLASLATFGACALDGERSDSEDAPDEETASVEEGLSCTTIDPSGTFFKYVEDTAIANDPLDPSKANANYGLAQAMYTGSVGTEQRRILMKFDLIGAGVPPFDSVVSASLTLRLSQSLGQAPVNVFAGTSVWTEQTATWNSIAAAPNGGLGSLLTTLVTAGVQNNSNVTITLPASTVNTWMNPGVNYGIVLDHPAAGRTVFGSEQAPFGLRPKLTVCHQGPTCFDGVQNGGESDVDCGSNNFCAGCADGQACFQWADCQSGNCVAGVCIPAPTCTDGILNQQENDVDCGGSCGPCGNGSPCFADNECTSGSCLAGICVVPASCVDGIQNQAESDVDCGGPCAGCANGLVCTADTDCASAFCLASQCAPAPTCGDGVQNQGETGVDCGGPCAACPSCNDGVQNQGETGVDCGGQCAACPSCNDGVQNQGETGVDCGGPCAACVTGGTHLFSRAFGSANLLLSGSEMVKATDIDAQGNIYVAAWVVGPVDLGAGPMAPAGGVDSLLAKFTSGGTLVWAKMLGSAGQDQVLDVVVTAAGDLYVGGTTDGAVDFGGGVVAAVGQGDGFLVKYDTNGNLVWHRPVATAGYDEVRTVALDGSGNVLFAGGRNTVVFVQKVSTNNVNSWSKTYNGGPGGWVSVLDVSVNASNDITFVGYYSGSPNFGGGALPNVPFRSVGYVAKLTSAGAHLFSKALVDTTNDHYTWMVTQNSSGEMMISGTCNGLIDYGTGPVSCIGSYLLKLDGVGNPLWFHFYPIYSGETIRAIEYDAAGDLYVTGSVGGPIDFGAGSMGSYPAANRLDAYVVKLNPAAGVIWQRSAPGVGGAGYYQGAISRVLAVDPQGGGVLVGGDFNATVDFGGGPLTPQATAADCWLAKYSP